tara:strand:+ start:578 stop:1162 length:585 start_codon:yes stop_codon:yes gene_type:complete
MIIHKPCFTSDECDKIQKIASNLKFEDANILVDYSKGKLPDISSSNPNTLAKLRIEYDWRVTDVAWLDVIKHKWIYDKLYSLVEKTNKDYWKFNLLSSEKQIGIERPIQYCIYKKGSFFKLHRDNQYDRMISISVQLTDSKEYKGGQVHFPPGPFTANQERGSVTIFPSDTKHQVTPLVEGVRESLVWWVCGNK